MFARIEVMNGTGCGLIQLKFDGLSKKPEIVSGRGLIFFKT